MGALLQDLRYAVRLLLKSPGFTAVAIVSLALGIGANATIFSFVNALLLRPLPVKDPGQVVALYTSDFSGPRFGGSSYPDFVDFGEKTRAFAGLAAYTVAPMSLSQGSHTDRVFGEVVTAGYFEVAGVSAQRGRVFSAAQDGRPDAPPALVLSDGLWRRRFGADPSLVGQPITLNGQPFTVVGIAPAGFTGMLRGFSVDLWVPMTMAGAIPSPERLQSRGSRWLSVIGRLATGVGATDAAAQLDVLAAQLQKEYSSNWTDVKKQRRVISVVPESQARLFPSMRGAVVGFLSLLMAVVGLVLLIACTNVASLLLARATARRRETAVRLSLGASRGRLIRQLLTESVLLSLVAGAAGVVLALWATDLLMAFKPPLPFPIELDLRPDARVLGFTLLLSLLTGIVFGLVPALQASRHELVPALKDDAGAAGRVLERWSVRRLLVVAQVAMSLVMLVGAGLFLQSLQNAHRIDLGFDPRNLLLLTTDLRLNGYKEPAGRQFYQQLLERTAALPGVQSVSLATQLPLGLGGQRSLISIEGYQPADGEDMEVHNTKAGPAHMRTMGIPLVSGRDFGERDGEAGPRVAIVNQAFGRRYWPGQDPLGKRIRMGPRPDAATLEVVGVAKDGKYVTLGEEPKPFFYRSFFQDYGAEAVLQVRTASDPQSLVAAVRREVQALDASLPVFDVKTMTSHLGISLLPARLAGSVLGLFGLVAVVLASVGIYGVIAHSVSQRTRELGVRVAIGARPDDLLQLVVGQGMRLAAMGVGVGLLAAFALARLATSLLYGISPSDPATFAGVAGLLAAVALAASYIPARRATRVDPIVALRSE